MKRLPILSIPRLDPVENRANDAALTFKQLAKLFAIDDKKPNDPKLGIYLASLPCDLAYDRKRALGRQRAIVKQLVEIRHRPCQLNVRTR